MPIPYTKHSPYKLIVNDDGTFQVKPGDALSKYNWAINGNWGNPTTWALFARPGQPPVPITPERNQNLIFAGETLIYLPDYKPAPGPTPGSGPTPGPGTGNPGVGFDLTFPMYQKDTGLKEKGNFLVQMIFAAQGMVSAKGITITAGDKEKLSEMVAADVAQQWVSEVDKSITPAELWAVAEAVKKGDLTEFNDKMGALASYSISRSFQFNNVKIRPTFRGESSITPVVLSATFDTKGSFVYNGATVEYAGSFTVTVKLGLSREGWKKILKKIGTSALRAFVRLLGSAVAAEIAAWCGFALLTVGATLGTLYLYEWVMEHGRTNEYAPIYARVYADSVFQPEWFRIPQQVNGPNGEEMVVAAIRDVIADMQAQGIEVPDPTVPEFSGVTNEFWRPNRKALDIYKRDIIGASGTDEDTARQRLYNAAWEKARNM